MLDGEGRLCVYSMVSTHVVIDVTGTLGEGYLPVARGAHPRQSARVRHRRWRVAGLGSPGRRVGHGGAGVRSARRPRRVDCCGTHRDGHRVLVGRLPVGVSVRATAAGLDREPSGTGDRVELVDRAARCVGQVCVFTLRAAHVVIDVVGYLSQGSTYAPVVPARVMDTRFDGVSIDHVCEATGRVASGTAASVPIAGRGRCARYRAWERWC